MVNKAKIGSISCGTLRTQDLLRAFADELERLSGWAEVIVAPHNSCVIADAREWASRLDAEDVSPSDELEAQEILGDIANELNKRAPAFCYFGAAEGDGADFGFWPCMEAIAELPRVDDGDEAKALGEDCAAVNDHGNVTVYGGDGEVIWDCV